MDNKEFGKQLEIRTKKFAISIIKLSVELPNSHEFNVIKLQLTKAGTSIGANYREANRARSKADFSNKIKICESESSETVYWLEILNEISKSNVGVINSIITEANELLSIFTSVGKSIRVLKQ